MDSQVHTVMLQMFWWPIDQNIVYGETSKISGMLYLGFQIPVVLISLKCNDVIGSTDRLRTEFTFF